MNISYYPIIKWKKGEQEALRNLKIANNNFYPIIEIIDECSPQDFFATLRIYYSDPIYFDTSRFDTDFLETYISYITKKIFRHTRFYP